MIISRTARDFTDVHRCSREWISEEELLTGDNEAQSRLWPGGEKAGQMSKKAYEARAFTDGKELKT